MVKITINLLSYFHGDYHHQNLLIGPAYSSSKEKWIQLQIKLLQLLTIFLIINFSNDFCFFIFDSII
ncbi:hypothetical protein CS536_20920 [Yersinia kristensenii]|nr:hypothetical protein CS536_20920 [Yersinia kristensenii]PJE83166.1 hypothetical protein CU276_14450 [Yersinia kristensenii]